MAREGLPLVADKIGRCAKKPEIPNSQSLGGTTCSLILHHICHNVLGKVVLQNQHIADDRFLPKRHCLLD